MRTKDVSSVLGIATSTLRKWCMSLKGKGYEINRDERDRRMYTDRDVTTLRTLQRHLRSKSMASATEQTLVDIGMSQGYTLNHLEQSIDAMQTQLQHMKQFIIDLKKRIQ